MESFRDRLDLLCRSRGVQYAELARRVGVTKSYIGQLVHGHSKPPPAERCRQLAEALELSPDERQQLLDLAVRERARAEARGKIEELDGAVEALSSAVADLLMGMLAGAAGRREALPEALEDAVARDELLTEVHALLCSGRTDARAIVTDRLAAASPERLANALKALALAFGGPDSPEPGHQPHDAPEGGPM
jgi:transcriptional regulator with XRE-family HTH domain